MEQEITKNLIKEVTGTFADNAFATLMATLGVPFPSVTLPLAKGLVMGLIENCYNNCAQQTLSVKEKEKFNLVTATAANTFSELAKRDGVDISCCSINEEYYNYAYEVAEHVTLDAIRQSENSKIIILGRFYGSQFYKGNMNWQDMHQIIAMISALTLRQIVMIHLIAHEFEGYDKELFIDNPSACVEVNRLLDYGIWKIRGAPLGTNDSANIQLKNLESTDYAKNVDEAMMLQELSSEDIKRTIEGLRLTLEPTNHF